MGLSQPKVYLVGRSSFDLAAFQEFLRDEAVDWRQTPGAGAAQEIVETAGRVCYMSFGDRQSPRTNEEYIHNLVRQGHESVLEHVTWSFLIIGVSRGFSHQLVRHRVGFAFSQLSQQYHDESEAVFVAPSAVSAIPDLAELWEESLANSKNAYEEILRFFESADAEGPSEFKKREWMRAIRSAARSVLPNATETKVFVTINARALRHFLSIRGSIPGDEEMRKVSALLRAHVKEVAPALFADFVVDEMPDGSPTVRKVPLN